MKEIEQCCQELLKPEAYYPLHKMEKQIRRLRELISQDENSPVGILVAQGVVAPLIECLKQLYDPFPSLQNEVLWILINILTKANVIEDEVIRTSSLPELLVRLFQRDNFTAIAENVNLSEAGLLVYRQLHSILPRVRNLLCRARHHRVDDRSVAKQGSNH